MIGQSISALAGINFTLSTPTVQLSATTSGYRAVSKCGLDKAKKTYSLLCNKPDCSHFGETCNAFFPYDCKGMEYYRGNIYMLIKESCELDEKNNNDGLWQETLELY